MNNKRMYDFVVFGATGFAGYHVALTLARHAGSRPWAVAGRNLQQLGVVLEKISVETEDENIKRVERIEADVGRMDTLLDMVSKTKVILNCVGPYRFYGEPVVKACVEQGTSYVDICGEPIFLERIALLYDELAKNSQCYIISACGFDCIPAEIGTKFAVDNFDGTLNSVEVYHQVFATEGVVVNFATLQSAIYGIAHQDELKNIRASLALKRRKRFPKLVPKVPFKGNLFYNKDIEAWCIPFLGADRSVLQRSILYDYEKNDKRPLQTQVYFCLAQLTTCLLFIIFGPLFMLLCKTKCGRYLLENYPQYMTFGLFTKKGPSKKQLENTRFKTTIIGTGWAGKSLNAEENTDEEPKDQIICAVEGGELGYVATSAMMVASAFTLLDDADKLPESGVLTTAAAFANTNLIDRLEKMGVTFRKC